ncbi:putative bifunctional diguanylate cyclase/phosphodiesterase [Gluconobacter kanchanaburiensis]|nr:GGDEF domain-containing phosphodiesterase [Gluconobacter kanchanaburiensis]MBF0861603.1 EAL domain-containing protein [Gluconobacter kanchanaburiensis]GBR67065.1 diguanylate cyclase [Gluconobacter kanchanaburiensis NBRC 103587]
MEKHEDAGRNTLSYGNHWPQSSRDDFVLHALDCSAIVAVTDTKGRILSVNSRFEEISGYSRHELIGNDHRMLRSGQHDRKFFRNMYRTIASGHVWHGEICNRRRDGSFYWVDTTIVPHVSENGKVTSYVAIRFDISSRKQAEHHLKSSRQKLQKAVNTDFLTKISNRLHFSHTLRRVLRTSTASHICLALLDVDTFKTINDTSGHDSGDRLLRKVAEKLQSFQSEHCFIARIGGDEFAILMTGSMPSAFEAILEDILARMRFSFRSRTINHACTVSIGHVCVPLADAREKSLLKCADLALYAAKTSGKNRIRGYHPVMEEKQDLAARLRRRVQTGLRNQSISVFYQPIFSLNMPGRISFEALLHWDHPQHKVLSPQYFPEIFGDPRLALALNTFVTHQVMKDMRRLHEQNISFERIAINVMSSDHEGTEVFRKIASCAEEMGVPLDALALEVTENIFARPHHKQIEDELDTLHRKGVQISLDDFGTGFASLTHLKTITFDYVKINRAFVAGLERHGTDAAIIRGVIDIVHSLGRKVVAEGIDNATQVRALLEMECDFVQGDFLCEAVPVIDIPAALEKIRCKALL